MDERQRGGWTDTEGRIDRPLGRGLEDVSHLFQSHRTADDRDRAPEPVPEPPADRDQDSRPARPTTALLRPHAAITRPQLAGMLREVCAGLEEGLRVIDEGVPCPPCGEIDLLALDRGNHLTIIDFEAATSDDLLLRGMGQADWIVRNLPNLRRMYAGRIINFSAPPRVLLLAPEFSPVFRRVVQLIPHVECAKYHAVESDHTLGVLFERVTDL